MTDYQPPVRPRSSLYDLAMTVGRVEGMVGQALTYLGDFGRKIEEHEKRIVELETQERVRKAQIALIATAASVVVAAISWVVNNIDRFV